MSGKARADDLLRKHLAAHGAPALSARLSRPARRRIAFRQMKIAYRALLRSAAKKALAAHRMGKGEHVYDNADD